ncbi:MAG: glycosyltransferase family 4 protein [Winogradskyella arenosi]
MTIGLVLPAVPAYSETFFRNKINGLQERGVHVKLFVNTNSKHSYNLNCEIYKAPVLHGHLLRVYWSILKASVLSVCLSPKRSYKLYKINKSIGLSLKDNYKSLVSNQFIIRHDLDWLHFGFGTMALKREYLAKAIGAKLAVSFRGFDIGVYPVKYPGCYDELFKASPKIHVISDDIKNLVYAQGGDSRKEISKITPAIDVSFFNNLNANRIINQPVKFISIGRLHWKKGFEDTLEALAILKQQPLEFEYTIIGDGPELESILFTIHQLQLQDCVTLKGKLLPEDVKQCLQQSDVYLQYSKQEGFCNAVLEAQAMGCLCVVSDAEGLPENVLHGQTGWVVPKRQPIILAQQIKTLLALNKEQQQNIRTQAEVRVQKNFSMSTQIEAFCKFYEI